MRRVYGLAVVTGMVVMGCGGGSGSGPSALTPPPLPASSGGSGTLMLRLGSGTVDRVDRILGDTTSFPITVTDPSGAQLATANPTLSQLQSGNGNVTVSVPLETSPETVNVQVTSTNRYAAITGFFAGSANMTANQTTPFSATLARHYTNADLSGTLALDIVVSSPSTVGGGAGTVTVDGAGNVEGGNLAVNTSQSFSLGAGTYSVNADGSFTLSTTLEDPVRTEALQFYGHLDSSKDVAIATMQSTDESGETVQAFAALASTIGPFSTANLGTSVGLAGSQGNAWVSGQIQGDGSGNINGGTLSSMAGSTAVTTGTYSVTSSTGALTAAFQTSGGQQQTVPLFGKTVLSSGLDTFMGIGQLRGSGTIFLGVDLANGHTAASLNGTYGYHLLRTAPQGNVELGTLTFDGVQNVTGSISSLTFPTPPSLSSIPAGTTVTGTYSVQSNGQFTMNYALDGVTETMNGFVNPRNNVAAGIMTDTGSGSGNFGLAQTSP